MPATSSHPTRSVLTVSELNRETRQLLESAFSVVWVEGELSNLTPARSGHLYFTLKDRDAAVSAAMFRNRNLLLGFTPAEGMQVLVRGRVSLYEPRGSFQLIVEHMEEAGTGALQRAYEALKNKLAAEGLFASERKRPLPTLPRQIGVVTSPTGAAIRDILTVLERRFPAIPVVLYPVQVQGEAAAGQIAAAIATANRRGECDVLIVGRGGGSLEDLWAFNEEIVARAIHASAIPVVSAVGHEVDVTIADFVADYRAPTPSAAAEAVSPNQAEWLQRLALLQRRLAQAHQGLLQRQRARLQHLQARLRHPGQRLQALSQRVDELEVRLTAACTRRTHSLQVRLDHLQHRLQQHSPALYIARQTERVDQVQRRLHSAMVHGTQLRERRLLGLVRALDAVSPLAVLGRGYAIVTDAAGGVVHSAEAVAVGTTVEARLHHGRLICTVEKTLKEK